MNTGVIMYADDIMIVADKKWKINAMLNICQRYGERNQIKWNPKKTQYMEINNGVKKAMSVKEKRTEIKFCGTKIDTEKQMRYLGVEISYNMKASTHIAKRRESLIKTSFALKNVGFNKKESETRAYLYKTIARPVLTYGLESISLTTNDKRVISTTEGNAVKGLLELSRKSRTKNLLGAVGVEPIINKIKINKLNFLESLIKNNYTKTLMNFTVVNRSKKSLVDEVMEMIGEDREHDGKDPINTACFHRPEPNNYEVYNTAAIEWILTKIKPTIKRIEGESKLIMLNNGLTDSIRNVLKMKDQSYLERNDENMSKITETLYLLIKSFSKTNIT